MSCGFQERGHQSLKTHWETLVKSRNYVALPPGSQGEQKKKAPCGGGLVGCWGGGGNRQCPKKGRGTNISNAATHFLERDLPQKKAHPGWSKILVSRVRRG